MEKKGTLKQQISVPEDADAATGGSMALSENPASHAIFRKPSVLSAIRFQPDDGELVAGIGGDQQLAVCRDGNAVGEAVFLIGIFEPDEAISVRARKWGRV